MKTIDYYNTRADHFAESTFNVDMESLYQPFLQLLSPNARILDLGCGSGRDSLGFKNKGYQVEAMDYSEELVKKAIILTGIKVKYQSFYDLNEVEHYDGIWACASLLHCDRNRLVDVIQRMLKALRLYGVIYMSFKYGDQDREKDGRYFTDLNEAQADRLLNGFNNLTLIQQWITVDKRPSRTEEWLNILIQKNKL
jgi:SAM-dependent methyltransferase